MIEFPLILLLTAFTYVTFQSQGAKSVRVSGVDLLLAHLNGEILSLTLLILPLLALAGMGVAIIARQAGGWTVDVAEAADRHGMRVILTFVAPQLLGFLLLTLIVPATSLGLLPYEAGQASLTASVGALNSDAMNLSWRVLVAVVAVGLGIVLARRGQGGLALFLAVFGLTAAHKELTVPSAPHSHHSESQPDPVLPRLQPADGGRGQLGRFRPRSDRHQPSDRRGSP